MTTPRPETRQIVISVLLRREGDRVTIKLARAERLGQAPQIEHEGAGEMAEIEDAFVRVCASYFRDVFEKLRKSESAPEKRETW